MTDKMGINNEELYELNRIISPEITSTTDEKIYLQDYSSSMAEILFITSYPPRECGIATYSQDLIKAHNNKFSNSIDIKVCALESGDTNYSYPAEVKYVFDTSSASGYNNLAVKINKDKDIKIVLIQHEFGFFHGQEQAFLQFLFELTKPVVIVFHTVLPHPDEKLKLKIKCIEAACTSIVVMTHNSAGILINDYNLPEQKNLCNSSRNASGATFKREIAETEVRAKREKSSFDIWSLKLRKEYRNHNRSITGNH